MIGNPRTPINGLYEAVNKASKQPPRSTPTTRPKASTTSSSPTTSWPRARTRCARTLLSQFNGKVPKGYELFKVPAGTVVVQGGAAGGLPRRQALRPLVRPARQPRAAGHGPQGPRAELRPDDQRADRHVRVHRQGTQALPRRHEAARRAWPAEAGPGPAGRELLPDLRDRARPEGRVAPLHRLPREPRRHRRPHGRPDLRRLQHSRRPRTSPTCSRPARCRSP